ncbi:DUF4112 domain-containing protein [Sphingomonas turrisvirgatae]|uniref:DUF4112 domain-containing protein n=1 Tax=Sphingomonas turrisvirgatae TaxID=1888892 RepID=A0A1E3M005_9SPHN|nr:DUF4112 domain-containing protein [Sphingomonas turrisvirgatae]ODP39324.1 hypothetical protein BFL28_10960 [Sphingomonas turrisvirgatae]
MARATRMRDDMRGMAASLPVGRDAHAARRRVEALEKLLERSFTIPGTRQTVGLDALLGLVPVGGDVIAAAMGAYMVWEARNLGISKAQMARMAGNVGFDWLIGLIPVVGDAADFFYRSNSRNLRIIRRHLDRHHPATATIDN